MGQEINVKVLPATYMSIPNIYSETRDINTGAPLFAVDPLWDRPVLELHLLPDSHAFLL